MTSRTRARVQRAVTWEGFAGVAGLPERMARHRRHLLPVLTYHRVLPDDLADEACPSTVSASPEAFESQMRFLASSRRVIDADELLRIRRGEQELRPGSVMVTFDDGYTDFADFAWPVLRALRVPAILFVPSGQVSGSPVSFWWDRLWRALVETDRPAVPPGPCGVLPLGTLPQARVAYRALREPLKDLPHDELLRQVDQLVVALGEPRSLPAVLDWNTLRELRREGLAVASHSVTHPLLTRIGSQPRRAELVDSIDGLRRELGETPPIFAYPSGACDDDVARDTADAGYEVAFTTRRSVNDLRTADWHRLDRINVGSHTGTGVVRAQLNPWVADLARSVA